MESTWIFDNGVHLQNEAHFLNFDSPGNNSETSHHNVNTSTNNITSTDIDTPTANANPSTAPNTPSYDYLNGSPAIDMLESNLSHTNLAHNGPVEHQNSNQDSHDNNQNASSHITTEHQHHHVHPSTKEDAQHDPHWSAMTSGMGDMNDLDINFFPSEHQQPIILSSQMEDTQTLHSHHSNNSAKATPVPPTPQSFEVSNYGNSSTSSSFMNSFHSPAIDSHNNSIRPDVVFTPLVSPAVTPMDSMINSNNNNKHGIAANGNSNFFSPLTSPALEAKSPMKMRKSSTTSPDDTTSSNKKKYSKRKTPGNTPIVGPTIPGRIAKQSPVIKARRSSSYASNINHHQNHQQQQQQQHQQQHTDGSYDQKNDTTDSTAMAPPKTTLRRTRTKSNASSNQPATPATLMNFKLESSHENGNSASSSPIILPSNGHSRRSSTSTILPKSKSISNNNSNSSTNLSMDEDGNEHSSNKKTSHKLAEQGRRNRMNQAITDLGTLIPEELSSTISIPSKATTVELASSYIKSLLNEIDHLKEKLHQSHSGSDCISNDSISPLETTDHHS